jgi:hypothetical protein
MWAQLEVQNGKIGCIEAIGGSGRYGPVAICRNLPGNAARARSFA